MRLEKIHRIHTSLLLFMVLCGVCCATPLSAVTYTPATSSIINGTSFHSTSILLPASTAQEAPCGVLAEPPACAPLAQAPYRPAVRRDYNDGLSGGLNSGLDDENEVGVVADVPLGDPLLILLIFAIGYILLVRVPSSFFSSIFSSPLRRR